MPTKPKRPSLSEFMTIPGTAAEPEPEFDASDWPAAAAAEPVEQSETSGTSITRKTVRVGRPSRVEPPKVLPQAFRTSIYFSRPVHDVLRDIAHHERKSVTDLINEGLDHVLHKRNYPSTQELKTRE